jgi:hypothetical protein
MPSIEDYDFGQEYGELLLYYRTRFSWFIELEQPRRANQKSRSYHNRPATILSQPGFPSQIPRDPSLVNRATIDMVSTVEARSGGRNTNNH